ncbi:sulfur carrier protein [Desulfitispora alkaliphila]|uniref:sulfur carrier protein ThiS n=1 Tax=Desulfitispora alkaliphila TaxID=622674 RepID=UPI003D1E7E6D
MEIILNGKKEEIKAGLNVNELLQALELKPEVVTVCVNGEVLKRENFKKVTFSEGDEVDILMFMGGGS